MRYVAIFGEGYSETGKMVYFLKKYIYMLGGRGPF